MCGGLSRGVARRLKHKDLVSMSLDSGPEVISNHEKFLSKEITRLKWFSEKGTMLRWTGVLDLSYEAIAQGRWWGSELNGSHPFS